MRVSLVTVGDELLAGDTVNTNAAWLGRRLAKCGVSVERVTVIPDRIPDIAGEVDDQRANFDAVIVTGGLGPTHDDRTMEAVAAAFGSELAENERVYDWLETAGYAADDLAPGTAALPDGAEPLRNPEGVAPGCVIGNVYVLPGVPDEMQAMFDEVAEDFSGQPQYVRTVTVDEPESALVEDLVELEERFGVTVGSYPGDEVEVKISGPAEAAVAAAEDWLRQRVGAR
ncbi:MAG: molybdopterin-binding protein [Haloarculaceae archaeon]